VHEDGQGLTTAVLDLGAAVVEELLLAGGELQGVPVGGTSRWFDVRRRKFLYIGQFHRRVSMRQYR
jgi:hypothetical protein